MYMEHVVLFGSVVLLFPYPKKIAHSLHSPVSFAVTYPVFVEFPNKLQRIRRKTVFPLVISSSRLRHDRDISPALHVPPREYQYCGKDEDLGLWGVDNTHAVFTKTSVWKHKYSFYSSTAQDFQLPGASVTMAFPIRVWYACKAVGKGRRWKLEGLENKNIKRTFN